MIGLSASLLPDLKCQVKHLGVKYFTPARLSEIARQEKLEVLELHHPLRELEAVAAFARKHPTLKTVIAPGMVLKRETQFA